LADVRAARLRIPVGDAKLDRTLVVVESQELLRGQKRGMAVALRKAKESLRKLERRAASGRIQREALEERVQKALGREHLSEFVVATVKQGRGKYHCIGTSMPHDGACWNARAWGVGSCVPTVTPGATGESRMLSAASGTWRSYSAGPRKAGSRPGVLRTNGPTVRCGFIPSPR